MSTTPIFEAGRPRISGPIRTLSRPLAPLAVPLAGKRWLPLYAILRHTGRTSGKRYSTPVVALRAGEGFIIPLPFGDATQWAKNLFAAGGGALRSAGREYEIRDPRIAHRDEAPNLPRGIRLICRILGLRQFVLVRRVPTET